VPTWMAALGLLGVVPIDAQAAQGTTNEVCHVVLGSVTATGDHRSIDRYAAVPPWWRDGTSADCRCGRRQ
jgi:hypothetical protein